MHVDIAAGQLPTAARWLPVYTIFFHNAAAVVTVCNPHTRAAYERPIRQGLRHCDRLGKEKDLAQISPRDVGTYLDGLDDAAPTKKLHLSGLRHFFDTVVTRHVVVLNPAPVCRLSKV